MSMTQIVCAAVIALWCGAGPLSAVLAQDAGVQVAGQRRPLGAHPRLLLDEAAEDALRARAAKEPRIARLKERLLQRADLQLKLPPLQHKLQGRRMLAVSREAVSRIPTLALAYRLSGERAYLKGALDNMLTVADFADWNPKHFLDVAEMATAVAIGYDWLFDELSPEQRALFRRTLIDKALEPSFATPVPWWVKGRNNWTQVCHAGLTLAALAIAEDQPELAQRTVERALQFVPVIMKCYAPDGGYPEGAGYWNYGTVYNCLLIAALQSGLGDDLGLLEQPGFLQTADYRLHIAGPMLRNFSYSDGSELATATPAAAAFYLAAQRQDPSLLYNELRALDGLLAREVTTHSVGEARFEWLLLIWDRHQGAAPAPAKTHYVARGQTPVATHRSSWDADATFVAIKGGSPSASHGHVDIGTFCLDADGVRWATDLGAEDYGRLEAAGVNLWNSKPGSERWEIFRLGPWSHNILIVNGQNQVVTANAPIARWADDFTIVDLSPTYAGQLAAADRGIRLRPDRSVRLQDDLTALPEVPATVRWAMVTQADIEVSGNSAILTREGKSLRVQVLSPAGAVLEIVAPKPPQPYEAPVRDARLLCYTVQLPAGAAEKLVVDFTPGSVPAPRAGEPIVPLKAW